MQKVYEANGDYTIDAIEISKIVRSELRLLIREELEAGTPVEALQYVLCNAIHTEILEQKVELKIKTKL